jgi:hypothetical protein
MKDLFNQALNSFIWEQSVPVSSIQPVYVYLFIYILFGYHAVIIFHLADQVQFNIYLNLGEAFFSL